MRRRDDVKWRDVISHDVEFYEPTTKCERSATKPVRVIVKNGSYSNAENDANCGKIIGSCLYTRQKF